MKNFTFDLENIFADGPEKVHVLADFDGTLTKDFVQEKKVPALISILRDHPGYLSPTYQAKAHELYTMYSTVDVDERYTLEEKKALISEWYRKHKHLLMESGLKRAHIEKLSQSDHVQFRDGAKDFLQIMFGQNIPVVIMSASGIGEAISLFCKEQGVDSPLLHYITNQFYWDEEGNAIGFQEPIIHNMNKDETIIEEFVDIYAAVKDRMNVLLLGNSIGDVGMVDGVDAQKVLKIGFLDAQEAHMKEKLEEYFDYVMVGEEYRKLNETIKNILHIS